MHFSDLIKGGKRKNHKEKTNGPDENWPTPQIQHLTGWTM